MNDELQAEIRQLLDSGRKIEAVKRYREETGAGLAEAKRAVEEVGRVEAVGAAAQHNESDVAKDVIALLGRGETIEAIKLYRQQNGTSLKASKKAVEAIAEENGIAMASGGGCLGVILLAIIVSAGIATCA